MEEININQYPYLAQFMSRYAAEQHEKKITKELRDKFGIDEDEMEEEAPHLN